MAARKKIVAGNWKMNGSLERNADLLRAVVSGSAAVACDVVVLPPFPYIAQAQELLAATSVFLGAQNVSEHVSGAFTGEVAAGMLQELGCRYVLVGHSERRALFAEGDELVAAKFMAVRAVGMIPILCVGESLAEREAGQAEAVVIRQLEAVLSRAGYGSLTDAVLAYEPVWAIGTGVTASPDQAQEMHAAIRRFVAARDADLANGMRILYGGSLKPENVRDLFAQPDIDGGLVGGASLQAEDFLAICRAVH